MKKKTHFISTTVGKAFNLANDLPINWIIGVQTKERISDLFLGPAKSFHSVLKFNNVTLVGKAFPECKVESPWISAERKFKIGPKSFEVENFTSINSNFITQEDLQSNKFSDFKQKLRDCFETKYVVFKKNNSVRGIASEKNKKLSK